MSKNTMNSLQKTDTTGVRFHRLIFGGVVALLPALMAAKGCDVGDIGNNNRACGGLEGLSCESDEFCKYAPDDSCGAADATGVCAQIPEVCGEIYAPVCGCDDETYENACSAHRAGVSVASEGECGDPSNVCGGLMGDECGEDEFCNYPVEAMCGAADGTGVCEPKPEACTEEYMPVCGCDGETYGNACAAHAEGVSVVSEGECGDPANACGGLMGAECDADEFCNYPPGAMCGAADQTGVCEPMPEGCDDNYDPVCGCDGATHSNACMAHLEGISVASEGECEAPAEVCGGDEDAECGEDEFCNYPPDAMCGGDGAIGVCEPIPELCGEIYAPVCGCDGATHSNACMAHLEGISVAFEGECEAPADVCGGDQPDGGGTCDEGEFCNYPPDAICGWADATGVCEPLPEVCGEIYAPVCGCDNETYDNACSANAAGVSVASEGECGEPSDVCGGLMGVGCGEGEFCNYPLDAMCGAADATGVCEPLPEACDANLDPVCGCDGQTYGNECEAQMAGVSMASEGECDSEVKSCGGDPEGGGGTCDEGEFCNYGPDAYCGFTDATGVCEPIPEGCTTEYDPVCGCDGETYGNECEAHAAGVAVNVTGDSCE